MFATLGLVRRAIFFAAAAATVAWAGWGFDVSRRLAASWDQPKASATDRMLADLTSRDAKAAALLQDMRAHSDARALEATLVAQERRGGLEAIRQLTQTAKPGAKPPALRLAELALNANLNVDRDQRDGVLLAHGPAVEVLSGADEGVEEYLDQLERAAKNPSAWALVRDDPTGLVVWMHVKDKALTDYYAREREWLAPALAESAVDPAALVRGLQTAKEYHPLVREALVDLKLGAAGFQLFLDEGPLVQAAVVEKKIPLDETLEVVFANRDLIATKQKQGTGVPEIANGLAVLRANKPEVWKHARVTPLALRLEDQAPDVAERVLQRFAADDVAAFLFAEYEADVRAAAASLDRFGDLAFVVLNRYHDDERFRRLLAEPTVGPRLIPYTARYESAGLDQALQNRAWIDKYVDPDGNPIDKEWWTKIPGGGLADVARNWGTGKPNEWSELGWGALDAADAALLIASFGTSAAVTEVGEQAVKRVVINEARPSATQVARGARAAAREALAAGRTPSLLRRTVGLPHAAFSGVGRTALRASERVAASVRGAASAWRRLPPALRKYTARALLGVGLFITLRERTAPMVAEKVGGLVESVVKDPARALGQGLVDALGTLGVDVSRWGSAIAIGLWVGVLGSLLAATWVLRPRRRQVVYVR